MAGILALAAVLRLAGLARTQTDPFYDAAVRVMGHSGHAFWTGMLDPSGQVSVDKPPVDLWLQVASTRLLGFGPGPLLLPVALAGVLGVLGLFDLVRTLAGARAGLGAALALAVLPMAVVTARSDTMDSVMAALLIGAFAVAARGLRTGRTAAIAGAGVLLGLAFEVKLLEAAEAAPALAALWWLGAAGPRRRRAGGLGVAGLAAVVVGLAWLAAMTVTVPRDARPFAFGSRSGSAWQAALVYDGWDRLTGRAVASDTPRLPAATRARREASIPPPPGPLRLLSARVSLGLRFGWAALLALAIAAAVLLSGAWRRLDRAGRAGAAALAGWSVLGTALACVQSGLRPRYLEAVDPAVAATLGGGLVLLAAAARAGAWSPRVVRCAAGVGVGGGVGVGVAGGVGVGVGGGVGVGVAGGVGVGVGVGGGAGAGAAGGPGCRAVGEARVVGDRADVGGALWVTLLAAGAALALAGAGVSAAAAAGHAQVSGAPGALPPARVAALSAYLRRAQGPARDETASLSVAKAGPLIARDDRPVLLLTAAGGRPLIGVPQLATAVRSGAVRTALLGSPCPAGGGPGLLGCSPMAAWIRAHAVDVSRAAGQPRAGLVYRFTAPATGPPPLVAPPGATGPPPWSRAGSPALRPRPGAV